ncbi:hypothetical protein [Streptomyces sp. SYP-A7185]|uniref:hypothetical protein n=1 Tax=Streptomyces sp. SYP-A7185 TaxID=3040076 RepID=UPI0038F7C634
MKQRLDQSTSLHATTLGGIDLGPLFTDRAQFEIPDLATRFAYKKEAGSSDTNHEYDSLKV